MTITSSSVIKKLLFLFLVISGLYYAKGFLIPLAIGAILATLLLPSCKWMEKKKVPRSIAALISLLVLLIVIGGIVALIVWQISDLVADISLLNQKALATLVSIQQYIVSHFGYSEIELVQLVKDQVSSAGRIIQTMAGSLMAILGSFILVLVYIFLLLYFRTHIKKFMLKISPFSDKSEMEQVIISATQVSQQYLVGLSIIIACLWIMYGIGFLSLGVKNAIFFAILCGLLEIVPFVGNMVGTAITVLVAAVHGAAFPLLIGIVITYIVVQAIQEWVLAPLILGRQVKINPLFTIIALILGELMWGLPGVILAIPLTAMFKIVCDHIESLKPYGFLIGEIESTVAEPEYIKQIKKWFKKK